MRVQPRPLVGVLVLLAYLAVFYGVWMLNGIDYPSIGDSADTLLKWYVAPLLSGAVVLLIATSLLGWWRPAVFESTNRAPRWTLIPGALMVVVGLVTLLSKDYSSTTTTMWIYLVVGSLAVGFNEELATRGVLLTGFRARFTEPLVWFWSSACFGLLHLPNGLFGAGPGALFQVFLTAALGTAFYLARRGTGTLITAMALHAFWDFSVFAGADKPAWTAIVTPLLGLLALFFVWRLLRHERGVHLGTGSPSSGSATVSAQ